MRLRVDMPDGSVWEVPVEAIALDRARHFAHEYDGDVMASLEKDTTPLFECHPFDIEDWARNNMDWIDVRPYARECLPSPLEPDYQKGWLSGSMKVVGDKIDIALARRHFEAENTEGSHSPA